MTALARGTTQRHDLLGAQRGAPALPAFSLIEVGPGLTAVPFS
jgi:hypothetical protein